MPRSRKKGPFVATHLIKKVVAMQAAKIKKPIQTYSRASTITPDMEGLSFLVHNGRSFELVHITSEKVGHKLGEFSFTRTMRRSHANEKKGKGSK